MPTICKPASSGMFFHVNWLHDRWYEAGFDEASGNAQQDNFGLGGMDGDPILADGNFFGGQPTTLKCPLHPMGPARKMQMFVFNGPNPLPSRTINHEALITFHGDGSLHHQRLVADASASGKCKAELWGRVGGLLCH
jgi:hypothetical protein